MSVLRRIWKSRARTVTEAQDEHPQVKPVQDPRSRPSSARGPGSVADGLTAFFTRDRKVSTSVLGGPVEFKVQRRKTKTKEYIRRVSSVTSSSVSSDIRCPSDLGEHKGSSDSLSSESNLDEVGLALDVDDNDSESACSFSVRCPSVIFHNAPAPPTCILPAELLALVCKYTPRACLPTLALVNHAFHSEATRSLYYAIDLLDLPPSSGRPFSPLDACLATLAEAHQLSSLVRKFKLHMPRSFEPYHVQRSLETARRAMLNLVNLKYLHLENAPLNTLHFMPFSLTHLHLELSLSYTERNRAKDLQILATWLTAQSSLLSLSLLNCDAITLGDNQCLSHLTSITGSATVAANLAQFRPVGSVSITVCKADELRTTPSRIMASLARSSVPLVNLELDLTMTDLPYEVYLTSAAIRLQFLRSLTVTGTYKSLEVLFKHIHNILLPLTCLHTIRLRTVPHMPHVHDAEFARVKIFYKLCPSLRLIQLPSCAEWFITVDESMLDAGGAPVVGKRFPEGNGLRRLRML